jgi:hypothetical protein
MGEYVCDTSCECVSKTGISVRQRGEKVNFWAKMRDLIYGCSLKLFEFGKYLNPSLPPPSHKNCLLFLHLGSYCDIYILKLVF